MYKTYLVIIYYGGNRCCNHGRTGKHTNCLAGLLQVLQHLHYFFLFQDKIPNAVIADAFLQLVTE
jgi:hypothetical protein